MTKLNKTLIIMFCIISILALLAFLVFISWPTQQPTARTITAKRENIVKRITVSGTITPLRQTLITAPYSGYIKKLFVKIGQTVNARDPIVSITETVQSKTKVYPLRAPYAGTVVHIQKTEGEFVTEGGTDNFIVRIDDLSRIYVTANVPETDIPEIKVGQKADLRIISLTKKNYHGVVRSVSLAPKTQYGAFGTAHVAYPMKIEITDKDFHLRPGMSAIADIIISSRKHVLMLPHEFVGREQGNYYVILADGKRQNVTTGLQNNQGIEIIKGLKGGEKVKQINYFNARDRAK